MSDLQRFIRVDFRNFKAFKSYRIDLKEFNILVGPNNAGKSTILAAFRILASALRRANSKRATIVAGPEGQVYGHHVDLEGISVADENIFHNYDNSEDAQVKFYLSNGNSLTLFFPREGGCSLVHYSEGAQANAPAAFRKAFNCPIGFVPVLGPVEHKEERYGQEAARLALFNYRAARNFRNIWYHYPDDFGEFRDALRDTWPGMDVEPPEVVSEPPKTFLYMFCPEERYPREIFWSGFGFQVWCQMLTHLIKNKKVSIFLIDEPDIYLHSNLQRQLTGLLRDLGPDILIATHSTEIITEAETDEIVVVDKNKKRSKRLSNPVQLGRVFRTLGSNTNPVLTQLARTRRALFVEGKDFKILSRFARKLGHNDLANSKSFAVIPVEGFNPEKIRHMIEGIEATLGFKIVSAALLDRDYRSDEECDAIKEECLRYCDYVSIHHRKEIENFLLVPDAIQKATAKAIAKRAGRSGVESPDAPDISAVLEGFSKEKKGHVSSRRIEFHKEFARKCGSKIHATEHTEIALTRIEELWAEQENRLAALPGKDALSAINKALQETCKVSVSATAIIDAMARGEVPTEMVDLLNDLSAFAQQEPRS